MSLAHEVMLIDVGFVLMLFIVPLCMSMGTLQGTTTTTWNPAVTTVFQVIIPIMYMIGSALYLIPRIRKGE